MIVLAYKGRHKGDGLRMWLGWGVIRLAQLFYRWGRITHTEILLHGDCNNASIGSATLMDGSVVRIKNWVQLNPNHWEVIEVPDTHSYSTEESIQWFVKHSGEKYDILGAVGAVIRGLSNSRSRWFCNEACGESMRQPNPHSMPPAGYIDWCLSLPGARICSNEFFENSTWEPSDAATMEVNQTTGGSES